jgi:hypothetical protein
MNNFRDGHWRQAAPSPEKRIVRIWPAIGFFFLTTKRPMSGSFQACGTHFCVGKFKANPVFAFLFFQHLVAGGDLVHV